jgi:hypothetical protein
MVLNKYLEIADRHRFFILFQLVQSQSQFGAASAEPFENYPRVFPGIFL